MSKPIREFINEYRWLSNFYPVNIYAWGASYPSVEHAYMSAKSDDPAWKLFCQTEPSPCKVKRASYKQKLVPYWNDAKVVIMYALIVQKFDQEPFKSMLIETGTSLIEEGNYHGDAFWGIDLKKGIGQNELGILIMKWRKIITNSEVLYNE